MHYQQITIHAPKAQEEAITMLFFWAGAEGVEIDDPGLVAAHLAAGDWDASVFDGQQLEGDQVRLRCLFAADAAGEQQLNDFLQSWQDYLGRLAAAEQRTLTLMQETLPETDWQQEWKRGFQPLPLGEKLWACPAWLQPPPDKLVVRINPGLAFGTGDHPTTAMTASLLEQHLRHGQTVLDLGAGSGILAIAALRLGAAEALAVDIDPNCRKSVAEHLALNDDVAADCRLLIGDVLQDAVIQQACRAFQADLILSNIVAAVIIALAPLIGDFLAPGGLWLCSGILLAKAAAVRQALQAAGWRIITERQSGEWLALACRREQG